MKASDIRAKLSKYYVESKDSLVYPDPDNPNVTFETPVSAFEELTEKPDFDSVATGFKPHLDRWFADGLITLKERATGKS